MHRVSIGPLAHDKWALCIGGASCVWDDVDAWITRYKKPWDGLVIAVNDIGAHWPARIDHWVSLHAPRLADWAQLRVQNNMPACTPGRWGNHTYERDGAVVDYRLVSWPGGSSGLFAAQIARALECTKVILCGIPITPTPHFAETKEKFHAQWLAAAGHWRGWQVAVQNGHIDGTWLRSMSGRTQELLGAPTHAWLYETAEST